jgi:hypothetical protein
MPTIRISDLRQTLLNRSLIIWGLALLGIQIGWNLISTFTVFYLKDHLHIYPHFSRYCWKPIFSMRSDLFPYFWSNLWESEGFKTIRHMRNWFVDKRIYHCTEYILFSHNLRYISWYFCCWRFCCSLCKSKGYK